MQQGYRILEQNVLDSFPFIKFDTIINYFMHLDETAFTQKYMSTADSANSRLRLLFLQADAITSEDIFIENILTVITPSKCFDSKLPIGHSNKPSYRRMELSAIIVDYNTTKIRYAIIDGKKIEARGGLVKYSRTVNERPGLHKVFFKVFTQRDGEVQFYPVAVSYHVE